MKKAQIVFAYGDCLAISLTNSNNELDNKQDSKAKYDLLPSIHGREILQVMGLKKGEFLITGSEDTTFKVLRVSNEQIVVE